MTVYTENIPESEMKLDMTVQDVSRAVQYYLNAVVFKQPVKVIGVEQLQAHSVAGGNEFRIKFIPEDDKVIELEEENS